MYLSHPSFKWLSATLAELTFAPVQLEARIRSVLATPTASAVQELERLMVETSELVAAHLPEIDGEAMRAAITELRENAVA